MVVILRFNAIRSDLLVKPVVFRMRPRWGNHFGEFTNSVTGVTVPVEARNLLNQLTLRVVHFL